MAKDNPSLQSTGKITGIVRTRSTPSSILTLPFRCLIKGYQVLISPLLGQNCRFHPTCSCYAQQALQHHGLVKGTWLSVKRILKCNPMHSGGFDYVPGTKDATPKNKL